jgi:uncharacterized protein YacL
MKVSLDFLSRIVGMLALAYLGANIGISLSSESPSEVQLLATQLLMLAGAGLGLIVTPRLTIEPIQVLLKYTRSVPLIEILFLATGGLLGLIAGVLLTAPLAQLPPPLRDYLPIAGTVTLSYIGVMIFAVHKRDLHELIQASKRFFQTLTMVSPGTNSAMAFKSQRYLLDTSAIIDGRIAAISETGFLNGTLLVPQFVLLELQALADSSDDLKRSKGRRGLELLSHMQQEQKDSDLPIDIIDVDVNGITRVDDKLVMLARQYQCPIVTNDFNLNRVAELQGVKVLSLNRLSDAIRPPVVQDQKLDVFIRNEGNARQQGVGYLDDGTPVIVEEARDLIGQHVEVTVTRLHQTQTGRLVFAQLANGSDSTPDKR